ncbi:MAG: oligoribonuclease [Demequinaceae bacterium]|nr:oligoribonuclease [Demequinaceae bacterium]
MAPPDRLVWIDCEMTGLDPATDALLEVACLVTDAELNLLGEGVEVVIKPPRQALEGMIDFVREMHEASGLLPLLDQGVSLAEAEDRVLAYVKEYVPEGKAPLAGNTIGMDRIFLERDMPGLISWLHYRVVDVSSIKELVRRWYPRVYFGAPPKTGEHRALGDIEDSLRELRFYRETVFVSLPGPDSAAVASVREGLSGWPPPEGGQDPDET